MTILYISPESSPLVHAAAAAVLYLHIGAGSVGLLSGAAAFVCRKGTALHRLIGKIFVASMLIMSGVGACVAPFLPTPERASVIAGILTFYLVLSSWLAVKRKPGQIGRFDYGLLLTSLSVTAAGAYFFWLASQNPRGMLDGQPGAAFVMFMIIGSLAAVGDLRLLINRGVSGATRLARHLWRMTVALFIAANSLFLGQQQVFPKALQGSIWLGIPALLILALLLYWLAHVAWGAYKRKRAGNLQAA
ncbi:DUF2306 domain-containing protein [Paucibacter sp. B2R-40]|uniref:DUF2306 domain-containing protein n=1 Tax=Paucibacter sp. B2R-40 TaxID=2893554 RepID=UPI0021E4C3B9|nr:DUF2306 domain-containing protein [Paucibacter sp. B2R-40]MCV2352810.1 DUF2306 domain-containing protein [Paucibacter sp. B2R-40]